MSDQVKFELDETKIPKAWYNLTADLPQPPPPVLHPGTKQPVGPDDLAPLFPMELIMQEVSAERDIEIPEPIRDVYRMWRPSPLIRARRLEKALGTPAKIYYKYEGVSPAGCAQAEHRGGAGLVQQAGRHQAALDRDRRRPVGLVARLRRRAVRHRRAGVHGARVVRPEAVPPRADGNLRRALHRLAVDRNRQSAAPSSRNIPTAPASLGIAISEAVEVAANATTPSTRSARCSTTCCCTRPWSARKR